MNDTKTQKLTVKIQELRSKNVDTRDLEKNLSVVDSIGGSPPRPAQTPRIEIVECRSGHLGSISPTNIEEAREMESNDDAAGGGTLEEVRIERTKLEGFLFNECNKISRAAIRFILDKWADMEHRLQKEIVEKEKYQALYENRVRENKTGTLYSEMAAKPPTGPYQAIKKPVKERSTISGKEVVLIKPETEAEDLRTNKEIKEQVIKSLRHVKERLKIRSIKQMRRKGLIIEVDSKKDVEALSKVDLSKKQLKIEQPKKFLPSLIVYDVEKELKEDEILQNLINKNFDHLSDVELDKLKEVVKVRYRYRNRENRLNWIIQMPGKYLSYIVNKGRVYMQWQTYRAREYINISRCFKCHSHGHVAKICTNPDQLCEICGSKEHLKKECDKTEEPRCMNCIRTRRKENRHSVRSKDCPEYLKQVDLYHNKTKWD
ncbi:uncharacterized protein LOC105203452 [Solenopsis invicta]|uniref:uncharacterized protein LOC105203452 n=1 Tax=Solenopsis invicta TaxID=13686 RepID=UPI00193D7A23|nr:uncharacterized protein LOC105203452 [Solenopsis invicta]